MATSAAIQKILQDMRSAIDQNKFIPNNRRKNMITLTQMGLTWKDAKNEIYALTEADYCKGPSMDYNDPTSDFVWVFKKRIESELLYIKFKVLYQTDGSVKVMSFHIDEPFVG